MDFGHDWPRPDHRTWLEDARCRGMDPERFYSERLSEIAKAKAVCAECPVRAECYADAAERREMWGVWGGVDFGPAQSELRWRVTG